MVHVRAPLVALLTLAPVLLVSAPASADTASVALDLPTPLRHASLAWDGAYAYVFGGATPTGRTTDILRFDPTAGTVTTVGARMPVARAFTAAVWDPTVSAACPQGCAYVFGGDGLDDGFASWSDDILRYEPVSDTVTLLSSMPRGRLGSAAIFDPRDRPDAGCDDGCAYVFAGNVATGCCVGGASGEILRYNPKTDTATILPTPLPDLATGPTAFFDGTHAYVFANGVNSDAVLRFDPVSGTTASMSSQFGLNNAAAVWSGTYGYVFGGDGSIDSRAIVRYHPGSDGLLTKAATLPTLHADAVAFWDGASAWVLGGTDLGNGTVLDDIVRYTLEPGAPRGPAAVAGAAAGEIRVTWTAPASNTHDATITGYKVYRGEGSTPAAEVADLGPVLAWTDTDRTPGVRYHYIVRTVDANGVSPASAEVSYRIPVPPTAPLDLTAQGTARDAVTLNWSRPADDGGASLLYKVGWGDTAEDVQWLATTSATTYRAASLQPGKTYVFAVLAYNSAGEGPSAYASNASIATPLAPTDITARAGPGAGEISVEWTPPASEPTVPPVTAYRVYRCTNAAPASCALAGESVATSYVDAGLVKNTLHYYFVRSVNSVGESPFGGWGSARTFNTPSAPTSVLATLTSDASASLTWGPPTSSGGTPVTAYRVFRSVAFGPSTLYAETTSSSLVDEGLQAGTRYAYSVAALNLVGQGPTASSAVTTPSPPGAPVNVAASLTDALGEARVTWQAPTSSGGRPVTAYTVHRGTAPGAYDVALDAGAALELVDTGLEPGTRYYYAVSAWNTVGEGARSGETSLVTWAALPPEPPVGLVATSGPAYGGVTLAWGAPPANGGLPASAYTVYRAEGSGAFAPVATVAGRTFADAGLGDGSAYRYHVTAANAAGEGAASAVATAVARAPVLPTRFAGAALAQVGGTVYLFGGHNASGPLDTILAFDPATNTTGVVRAVLPAPRWGVAAVAVDGKVWLFGGRNASADTNEIVLFDPATLAVTVHPATTFGARHEIAATLADGDVWLYGGRTVANSGYCSAARFRPSTGVHTVIGSSPCMYGGTAISVGGDNIVVGGCNVGFASCGRAVAQHHRASGAITTRSNVLGDEHIHAAVVWDGTSIVVLGGWDGDGESRTIEVLQGATSSKTLRHELPAPRSRGAAWWDGERVLVFGGTGCGGAGGFCPVGPIATTIVPGAPQALAAAPTGDGTVFLQWLAPPASSFTALVAYELTRIDADGNRTPVATLAPTRSSFTDTGAPLGPVRYELVARGAGGHAGAAAAASTLGVRAP